MSLDFGQKVEHLKKKQCEDLENTPAPKRGPDWPKGFKLFVKV